MKTHVQKWGNSLALRIPKAFAVEVGLQNGSLVEMSIGCEKLIITPLDEPRSSYGKPFEGEKELEKIRGIETGYLRQGPFL